MFEFEEKVNFYEEKVNEALTNGIGDSLSTVFLDLLTNICNFNCTFCDAKQLYDVKNNSFTKDRLDSMVNELIELSIDSVLLVGEGGEPIIHPYFNGFSRKLLDKKIKLGIYTNGSILNQSIFETLSGFEFVRISLNAGTEKSHQEIHRYKKNTKMFHDVLEFINRCSLSNKNSVGVSSVILRENMFEIYETAKIAKDNGAHYVEFKPAYMENYSIDTELYSNYFQEIKEQLQQVEELEDEKFKVVLNNQLKSIKGQDFSSKIEGMTILDTPRDCITSKLRMVVSPTGCYLCTPHRSKDKYSYGNPKNESLVDIWNSKKHYDLLCQKCNLKCAYHQQNELLLSLKQKKEKFVANKHKKVSQTAFL